MRVLVGIDGSDGANVAVDLVSSLAWPPGSSVRVLAVLPDVASALGAPWAPAIPPELQRIEDELLTASEEAVDTARDRLRAVGASCEGRVARGRVPSVIVEEAVAFKADLVVVGSRGQGLWATSVLGSVSAEVADRAPCPVLVARRGSVERIVLADDGSEHSEGARRVVRDWPVFAHLPVSVVSVGAMPVAFAMAVAPGAASFEAEQFEISLREARRSHDEIASRAQSDLSAGGRSVERSVRIGSPAEEIVSAAEESKADLIVVGSHGRTGVGRLLIGSVARSVLLHARCSVLIVRRQATVAPG
jgi:nucleotide-binding universal stress UspA family protein